VKSAGYRITQPATRDIDDLLTYIAQDSIPNALKVYEKLQRQFESLAQMPGIGHTREELHDDTLRVVSVYSYLIIYEPSTKPVIILRVVHCARDINNIDPRPIQ